MRRKDKEITDPTEIKNIIKRAKVCRLALSVDDQPYIVPMSFGYEDNTLYFHCAKQGKKIDMIKQNNRVCFEIDIDHEVVLNLEETSKSTMKYKSVIGLGKAFILEDKEEIIKALNMVMRHYTHDETFHRDYEKTINAVLTFKVVISEMTGKGS